jgi:2-keto-4-pentenoate hydratase/2-oxohepta-3-ene-1,7-dioic acid hydratase in catechol pathway
MRFVRFVWQWSETPNLESAPYWGMMVDDLIYPLADAPYARILDGRYAPEVLAEVGPLAIESVRLLAPVTPSKIICVGRNYADHAAETGSEVPKEPLIFLKAISSLLDVGEDVVYPSISQRVDHEAEIAVLIGKHCRFVDEADALDYVFGYTVANDVTARDLQNSDGQWSRAKGFDTFCPVGPWIDSNFDPRNRAVRCQVNDTMRQESNTDKMIFSIPHVISYISQAMTLVPGDLILMGTPDGISAVQPGDVMTVEVEGLGVLRNTVISEAEYRSGRA